MTVETFNGDVGMTENMIARPGKLREARYVLLDVNRKLKDPRRCLGEVQSNLSKTEREFMTAALSFKKVVDEEALTVSLSDIL
jgi:hypothetical protein